MGREAAWAIGRSIVAGALAWGSLALVDLLVVPDGWMHGDGERALASGVGVGVCVGALVGALHAGVHRLLENASLRRAFGVWLGAWVIAAAWVAGQSGAWGELNGPQRGPAILLVVGLVAAATFMAALSAAAPPRRPRGSRAWPVVVFVVAAGAVLVDRVLFLGEVPIVHEACRVVAAWAVMLGLFAAMRRLPAPRRAVGVALGLAIACVGSAPFVLLDASHRRTLQVLVDRPFTALPLAALRAIGDRDGDGHSAWLGGADCAPENPAVHPGAPEIADNGIDDNCVLGDARARPVDASTVAVPTDPSPVNVVLVTVDTLSAAHTSLHGHDRSTTPNLDAWAAGAVVFDRAYASGGWTAISIPSLLRGVYARRLPWALLHRTSVDEPPHPPRDDAPSPFAAFPVVTAAAPPPLPWWLSRRDMQTVAIVDDGATMILSGALETDEGFDRFVSMRPMPDATIDDAATVKRARDELAALLSGPPFFLWVHLYGPHEPSEVHEGVPDFGSGVGDRYDHEIAATDRALSDLLADIDAHEGRPTMVVVTSDHGEDIDSGQRFHGTNTRESVIHVPLVIKAPGVEPRRDARVVSLVDVVPTILAATATPAPPGLDGIDLLAEETADAPRIVITDTWRVGADGDRTTDLVAALDGEFKVQLMLRPHVWSAFDQRDPDRSAVEWGEAQLDDLERAVLEYLEQAGVGAQPRVDP